MLKKYPKIKKIVIATTSSMFFWFIYGIFSPFLSPYLVQKGFTESEISLIFAFAPFGLIFLSAIFGRLADITGRKKILILAILAIIGSMAVYIFVPNKNFTLIIAASFVMGVAQQIYLDISRVRVQDHFSNKSRGLSTGVYESLGNIGNLIGITVGSSLVLFLPISDVFKVTLVLLIAFLAFGFTTKKDSQSQPMRHDLNFLANMKEFLKIKNLRGMALLGLAINFSDGASTIFIPLLLVQEMHANIGYVGLFAAILSLSHITQFMFGKVCDIFGESKMVILSIVVYCIAMSLFFFAPDPNTVIVLGIGIGLSAASWNTSACCYMSKIGEKYHKEGLILGAYTSFSSIGVCLGYVAASFMTTALGSRPVFLLYSGVILVAVILAKHSIYKES